MAVDPRGFSSLRGKGRRQLSITAPSCQSSGQHMRWGHPGGCGGGQGGLGDGFVPEEVALPCRPRRWQSGEGVKREGGKKGKRVMRGGGGGHTWWGDRG